MLRFTSYNLILSMLCLGMFSCGDPNSDRIIVLPDSPPPTTLVSQTWSLVSTDKLRDDDDTTSYLAILDASDHKNFTNDLQATLYRVQGDTRSIVSKINLKASPVKTATEARFHEFGNDHELWLIIDLEDHSCQLQWHGEHKTDTNETYFHALTFDGTCKP